MRLLFLDEEFPYPLNSGKRIRSYSLVTRLARRHAVDYLAFGRPADDATRALAAAGVGVHPVDVELPAKSGAGFYWRLLMNLFARDPFSVTNHRHRLFAERVEALTASGGYDAIVCEWTPYVQYVRRRDGTPRIVCAHNIEHRIWQRLTAQQTNPLRRIYAGIQAVKWRRFEQDVFSWIDGAAAVSTLERDAMLAVNPDLATAVVDNGVDLETFRPDGGAGDDRRLVFVGSLDWLANQDAVQHCVEDIMPLVRRLLPDVRLTLVGRNPTPAIRALDGRDGIAVTGTVPDVTPYVREAAVFLVPLRVGGGSRLKILEALAMGRAVVSTSVGAEGLDVEDGRHLVIADAPHDFARAVADLAGDPDRRRRLGEQGRRLVEERYGWDALAERFGDFIAVVAGGPR
jgi:sugar transferase (PEP-CTERM/EpsH1 system associated)